MGENTLKLLIVGAGITGSVIAFELKRLFAEAFLAGKMSVSIWDKARGPGMSHPFLTI
jgi:L-2-hydroxyglutarate oxidase LhgO